MMRKFRNKFKDRVIQKGGDFVFLFGNKKKYTAKNKKKMAKKALKSLLNDRGVINKFRAIFGMYDYKKDDVRKEVKRMIKKYKKSFMTYDDPDSFIDVRMKEREQ
jgi:hypothetical protein